MKPYLPVCLFLLSFSAYGVLNKWVDADGKVHYSDEPPPLDVKAKKLAMPSAASGVPAQKTYIELESELKKTQKAKEEAGQKASRQQEETLAKQKHCASLRTHLTTLENSPRIATYNDKGERTLMDDATRQKEMEEARKQISSNCNY